MHVQINSCKLELVQGDITRQEVDAIINAANSRLAGGGGVDGAIHRRGGPEIMVETDQRYPDGCPTGEAVVSGAGMLLAQYVIHAVGPIWHGGKHGEAELLASAYRRSLEVAVERDCQSVAFPALSTGAYGYPLDKAATTTIETISHFLRTNGKPKLVRIVLFDDLAMEAFSKVLTQHA